MGSSRSAHRITVSGDEVSAEFETTKDSFIVGRDHSADLSIPHTSVSRRHLKITLLDEKIYIEDVGSQNGTWVNGKMLTRKESIEYSRDQLLEVGKVGIRVKIEPSWVRSETQAGTPAAAEEMSSDEKIILAMPPDKPPADFGGQTVDLDLDRLRNKCQALEERKGILNTEIMDAKKIRREMDREIASQRAIISDLISEAETLKQSKQQVAQEIQEERKVLATKTDQHKQLKREIAELESQKATLEVVTKKVDELAADIEKKKKAEDSLDQRISEKEKQLIELKKEAATSSEILDGVKSSIKTEKNELHIFQKACEKAKEESRELLASLAEVKAEATKNKEISEKAEARLEELLRSRQEAEKGRAAALQDIEKLRTEERSLELAIAEMEAKSEKAKNAAQQSEKELKAIQSELTAMQETARKQREEAEVADRKMRAELEAYTAERKAERLKLEIEVEKAELDRSKLTKELHYANQKKEDFTQEYNILNLNLKQTEEKLKSVEREIDEGIHRRKNVESEVAKAEAELFDIQKKLETSKNDFQRMLEELRRDKGKQIEAEFLDKYKMMDVEVANKRLDEEKKLEKVRTQYEKTLKARNLETAEVVARAVSDLIGAKQAKALFPEDPKATQTLQQKVGEVVVKVLDPEYEIKAYKKGSANNKEARKTQAWWRNLGYTLAGVLAVVAVLGAFPQLPGLIASKAYRAVSSDPNATNAFTDEIKRKGEKFHPKTERFYRGTYTDNILYAEDYLVMKSSDEVKKQWAVDLNRFFIDKLNLGDRVIAEFAGAEAVLMKELSDVAEMIPLQFKDLGIKKMQDIEAEHLPRLKKLLRTEENYDSFRVFEKMFYMDYLSKLPQRK